MILGEGLKAEHKFCLWILDDLETFNASFVSRFLIFLRRMWVQCFHSSLKKLKSLLKIVTILVRLTNSRICKHDFRH